MGPEFQTGDCTTLLQDGSTKQGGCGRAVHWPIILCHKRLSKEVAVGNWALSGSPGSRVLDSAFAVRSPPGL